MKHKFTLFFIVALIVSSVIPTALATSTDSISVNIYLYDSEMVLLNELTLYYSDDNTEITYVYDKNVNFISFECDYTIVDDNDMATLYKGVLYEANEVSLTINEKYSLKLNKEVQDEEEYSINISSYNENNTLINSTAKQINDQDIININIPYSAEFIEILIENTQTIKSVAFNNNKASLSDFGFSILIDKQYFADEIEIEIELTSGDKMNYFIIIEMDKLSSENDLLLLNLYYYSNEGEFLGTDTIEYIDNQKIVLNQDISKISIIPICSNYATYSFEDSASNMFLIPCEISLSILAENGDAENYLISITKKGKNNFSLIYFILIIIGIVASFLIVLRIQIHYKQSNTKK